MEVDRSSYKLTEVDKIRQKLEEAKKKLTVSQSVSPSVSPSPTWFIEADPGFASGSA